jgi:hypothetical protein
MDLRLATLKAVSFSLLHNVSTLNQYRKLSCVTAVCKHFASYQGYSNYTSQQDFVPRKVYCVSNVTFHAESKYAINIFPSPTVFVQWHFLLLIFRNFSYFLQ